MTDRETLVEYRRVLAGLRETRLAREGSSFSVHIGGQDGSSSSIPDEDSLRALFGAFRHVWLDDEPASFTRTCQVLHRSNLTDEEREALTKCRESWKDVHRTDPIKINLNGQLLRPRRLIELYFNSVYFHRDQDKRPPDADAASCENALVRKAARLVGALLKCRVKAADAAFRGLPFDAQGCEDAARTKYDTATARMFSRGGCPPCAQANAPIMSVQIDDVVRQLGGLAYCAGSVPIP